MSPNARGHKANQVKTSADSAAPVARQLPTLAETDPGLALILAAWPTLPAPIRRAMLALVESGR
jgi:hypothetical protein